VLQALLASSLQQQQQHKRQQQQQQWSLVSWFEQRATQHTQTQTPNALLTPY
jgi:hypothetical protein